MEIGKPSHDRLDWEGDALLRLHRGVPSCACIDLHLHVGNIGYRINGQVLVAVDAEHSHPQDRYQDESPLVYGYL